jgi:hypothetical protein
MPRRFDHCVLCVRDLERAAQTFVALGFTLTPIGQLPFGVSNRVALFGNTFLELLAVSDPAAVPPHAPGQFSFGAHNQAFLAEGEGMSMLAWHSSDARGDARRFNSDDCGAYAPFDFGRDVVLPSGERALFNFSLAFATDLAMPRIAFFVCQQRHAPELFWRPRYQGHPNGTQCIAEIILSAAEPGRHRAFLERICDGFASEIPGGFSIRTDGGRLTLLDPMKAAHRLGGSPEEHGPRFCAVGLEVTDLAVAAQLLGNNRIEVIGRNGGLLVPATEAHGLALEFVSKEAS